ncbi:MAG TPA: lipopolysaccharide transport periplasmic protein LptA [Stenotrophomonas sp.]|nr:lipopolysaccharide transport periplasmic protein LptA [Stenotrophomonas sp.]
MNPTLPARLAATLLLAALLPLAAQARTSDRNQPMNIDSATNDCNLTDDDGKCRFTGNVVITQGSLEVRADTADLFRKAGAIDRIVLIGRPATMKQLMDDGSPMNAKADNIEYRVNEDTIILTGNYTVDSPKGSNAGQRMTYNTKTGNMQSGGDGTRVRTVIQPKTQAPAKSEKK